MAAVHGPARPELLEIDTLVGELSGELQRHLAEEEERVRRRLSAAHGPERAGGAYWILPGVTVVRFVAESSRAWSDAGWLGRAVIAGGLRQVAACCCTSGRSGDGSGRWAATSGRRWERSLIAP